MFYRRDAEIFPLGRGVVLGLLSLGDGGPNGPPLTTQNAAVLVFGSLFRGLPSRIALAHDSDMHSIVADFYRFKELTVDQIMGHDGVIVAYGSRAKARASFIFAGEITTRLKDAWDKESLHSTDGFIALMGNEKKPTDLENAQLTRAILLMIGEHTDRGGIANIRDADFDKARRRARLSNIIKLRVKGHDPLIPPWEKSILNDAKEVSVFLNSDGVLVWDSGHWKLRKKRHLG